MGKRGNTRPVNTFGINRRRRSGRGLLQLSTRQGWPSGSLQNRRRRRGLLQLSTRQGWPSGSLHPRLHGQAVSCVRRPGFSACHRRRAPPVAPAPALRSPSYSDDTAAPGAVVESVPRCWPRIARVTVWPPCQLMSPSGPHLSALVELFVGLVSCLGLCLCFCVCVLRMCVDCR